MTNMDFVSPDNYKVIRRIGVGAMGNVYEVEHKELGVRYALDNQGTGPSGE